MSTAKKAYLAIDLGAESGRGIVGVLNEVDGKTELETSEVHRFPHTPKEMEHPFGTCLHWDWDHLRASLITSLAKAQIWCQVKGLELISVGVDAWGVDFGYLDQHNLLIMPPLCYRDPRNHEAYELLLKDLGKELIYQESGIQFMPINSLPQLYAQKLADAEVDEADRILPRTKKLLFIPDLMHMILSGKCVSEETIASTSQMLHPSTRQWSKAILDKLEVDAGIMPDIVAPGATIGTLLPEIAKEAGIEHKVAVITPPGHDTGAAIAAIPADEKLEGDWCYLSSGTWSLIGAEIEAPNTTVEAMNVPFTNELGLDNTVRFLKNVIGLWLVQESRRHFEKQPEHQDTALDYTSCTEYAVKSEPLKTLVNTQYAPFQLQGEMPEKIVDYARATGQPVPQTIGETFRCALESLALRYRQVLEQLESVLNKKFTRLHIVGGGGRNELLNQLTANTTGCTVLVGPEEATGIGNLLVQAKGAGDVRDLAHLRQIVSQSVKPKIYEPQDQATWQAAYERYTSLPTNPEMAATH